MRRITTALALLTITLTAAACDPYQALEQRVPGSHPDSLTESPVTTRPKEFNPHVKGDTGQNIPAEMPNTNF